MASKFERRFLQPESKLAHQMSLSLGQFGQSLSHSLEKQGISRWLNALDLFKSRHLVNLFNRYGDENIPPEEEPNIIYQDRFGDNNRNVLVISKNKNNQTILEFAELHLGYGFSEKGDYGAERVTPGLSFENRIRVVLSKRGDVLDIRTAAKEAWNYNTVYSSADDVDTFGQTKTVKTREEATLAIEKMSILLEIWNKQEEAKTKATS